MKIVVIADDEAKNELLAQGTVDPVELIWQQAPAAIPGADAYLDLLFTPGTERINKLREFLPAPVIVNSVITTTNMLPAGFTRINGWKTFLKRPVVETAESVTNNDSVAMVFSAFNKTIEWVPDIPGFITARVISMIINEAWFTFEEKVSTKAEIDTAMKLGTNYPYGPFEWGEKIGLKNVYELLNTLAATNSRYQPAALLQKQAGAS